jgi:hypothetical protein
MTYFQAAFHKRQTFWKNVRDFEVFEQAIFDHVARFDRVYTTVSPTS